MSSTAITLQGQTKVIPIAGSGLVTQEAKDAAATATAQAVIATDKAADTLADRLLAQSAKADAETAQGIAEAQATVATTKAGEAADSAAAALAARVLAEAAAVSSDSTALRSELSRVGQGLSRFQAGPMRNLLFIGDSLTAGAGGTTPVNFVKNAIRTSFGDGGYGYAPIGNSAPFYSKTGMGGMPASRSEEAYSVNFEGTYDDTFATGNFALIKFLSNWDTVEIGYLKQPGGGEFEVDHSNAPGAYRYSVDTDSVTTEVGWITVTKAVGGSDELKLRWVSDGKMCFLGAIARQDNAAPTVHVAAYAGKTALAFASQNATAMTAWYAKIAPDVAVINLGMNDRLTRTAAQILADVQTIIGWLPATTDIVLVGCNQPSDEGSSSLTAYRALLKDYADAQGYGYIDNTAVLGTYATANSRSLMLDGVHPNTAGNALIAANYLRYMGLPAAGPETDRDAYDDGSGGPASYVFSGDLADINHLSLPKPVSAVTGASATCSGTTMTVTIDPSVGAFAVGQLVTGTGFAVGSVITALGTGTGGTGTYTLSTSQTVGAAVAVTGHTLTTVTLYSLGLTNGTPQCVVTLDATSTRAGTGDARVMQHFVDIRNSTIINRATAATVMASTSLAFRNAGGIAHNYLLSVDVIANRAVVSARSVDVTYDGRITVRGKYAFNYLTVTGVSVFEA